MTRPPMSIRTAEALGGDAMARILLVDDSPPSRSAVRRAIQSRSTHEMIEAEDGESALARLAREDFDIVLLEVRLPRTDGFEVCRRLRAVERSDALPVIFLTAASDVENRLRALELGAADFIVKPVADLELLARLESVLRSKVLADEVRRHNEELASKVVERTRQLEELANELRLDRDALRETFDVIADALLLMDGSGELQIANAVGRRLYDGDDEGDPHDGHVRASLVALASDAIARDATCDIGLIVGERQLLARAYPAAGRRALIYVRDVTEERDKEIRRLQSEKLASIGLLATGVAHEINNPASFVLANVEALAGLLRAFDEKLRLDPASARKLGVRELLFEAMTIVQESKEGMARIHRIVRDLHSFSRVDDDANTITDVNTAIESSLTMLRNELRYRTGVERDLRATQPVRASVARLGQVFLNLILNAAHALPEGQLKRNKLWVRSYDDGRFVVVEVQDNGPGIEPGIMPRIFESFFTTKPKGVGTGLGLPISREIVRSIGGELLAESEQGRGALFRVRVPAESAPAEKPKTLSSLRTLRRRRILAIDDEALLLKAYRRMLIDHHDVETKLGAKETLRSLMEDRSFEVVLCDLQMPEMSGAELYQEVRNRWPDLAERFIFITGGAFSPEARRFLDESVIACIHKPFQVDELLELIETRVNAASR